MIRKFRILNFVWMWALVVSTLAYGQETSQVGTSTANFLKIGVGSRAAALGDAFVAMANDASSLYWNPGGLGSIKQVEFLLQSNSWIADTDLHYLGLALPVGNVGTFGASVYSFTSGDIDETTLQQPEGTGRVVSASDIAIGASYARQLTDRFFAGMTVKYIGERLSRETASSFAVDIGSLFITNFLHEMRIGISLSNLGSRMLLSGPDMLVDHDLAPDLPTNKYADASLTTQDWDLPLIFRFGLATDIFRTGSSRLTTAFAVNDSRDFEQRYNVGAEYALTLFGGQQVFLRTGYKGNYDEEDLTAGGGLNIKLAGYNLGIDYAYAGAGRLGNTQRYSIQIIF